ncbi:MAG: hypothetical protein ABIJ59_07795 [Pseudomonadota bacterium]
MDPIKQIKDSGTVMVFLTVWVLIVMFSDLCLASDIEKATGFDCITQFENGSVNWSTGNIIAIGKAAPKDYRETSLESVPGSARANASRQIIELLQQIKIDHAMSVGEYASKNDIILAGMEKTARDAVVIKQYYTSALAVEIHIETSMYGGFLQLILPEEIRQISKISSRMIKQKSPQSNEKLFTGLIIDAKGLGVEPVLNPRIISEQGHDVYSSAFISREFAVQNGVCKYVCSKGKAYQEKRMGDHPLGFKGLRKEGKLNAAIVISMSDYQRLEKITERHSFLAECRVTIIID